MSLRPYRPTEVRPFDLVDPGKWFIATELADDADPFKATLDNVDALVLIVHPDDEQRARDVVAVCAEQDVDVLVALQRREGRVRDAQIEQLRADLEERLRGI